MPPRPLLLLLDFDGTLTHHSTLPLLLSLHPSPLLPSLTTSYTTSLSTHTQTYHPLPASRKTIAAELRFLASLTGVEKQSIERLERAGIWKGVSRERIEEGAREGDVVLRKGWGGMVACVQKRVGGRVGVVSVAWSRLFISACLREGVRKGGGGGLEVGDVDVRANEIVLDADGKGTGRLDRYFLAEGTGIWTAEGKVRVMHELIEKSACENGGVRPWTVYIGDSPTDLGCLMEADVGVCVRDEVETREQEGLREVLERVGVECLYVGEWKERMERQDEGSKCLCWARDFEEVRKGILEGG